VPPHSKSDSSDPAGLAVDSRDVGSANGSGAGAGGASPRAAAGPAEPDPAPGATTPSATTARGVNTPPASPAVTAPAAASVPIEWRRYRKMRLFVARTFAQALFWDVFMALPGLARFRRPAAERYRKIARRYRALAIEMGGVLIKLGQFLSTRFDVLPAEVIRELSGLQDEVPPHPFLAIVHQIEEDFGRPLGAVFSWIEAEPVGAASLAQVHRARLPGGEQVVVKVLRPGIEVLVETDLAATSLAIRLLKLWRRLRRRVDLDRLDQEFRAVTRRELDLHAEGGNAERFARDFAGDPRVYMPRVFWEQSARRTLTLEDVGWLKISGLAALEEAGIDRSEVARHLYQVYMRQIFVHHFVHADPHPGNLFVRPLPVAGEAPFAPGDPVSAPAGGERRPFQIAFVDFGMVAEVPERLRGALREYLIGLGTRDAARVVHSYVLAGVLLPGADLRRLEQMHAALFDRFWGVRIGELRNVALAEARGLLLEYRDLLYEAPFQIQVDLLFVGRAVGLLSGLATRLDPGFDPWAETLPFAKQLAAEELRHGWRDIADAIRQQVMALAGLPRRLDSLAAKAEQGTIAVQASLAPEVRRTLERVDRAVRRLAWTVAAAALLVAGALLRAAAPADWLALLLMALALAVFLLGLALGR
jgi:predicted unusual protein kinase regulating ubiquinone biosynthesis (AarF/ABC1/UbiB family)